MYVIINQKHVILWKIRNEWLIYSVHSIRRCVCMRTARDGLRGLAMFLSTIKMKAKATPCLRARAGWTRTFALLLPND